MRRIVRNQSSYVSIARNNDTLRINVRNSTVGLQETNPPTLCAIAQSGMPQFIDLISVNGKSPWILDSEAISHLIGFQSTLSLAMLIMRKCG
ncbi:hypothetical protein E5676_scaffold83G001910 [Cucumis melo var. makuwa]|uniref:Uncharacterized protein n=1 Tax=Cucumis melo var. makuwa TaxID=1194695 RepID=A0A5D3C277_CUCMM|nr:hypothetical protein E5676_scaffold83G001910 [Cucumis melo var. makuwa]